MERRGGDHLARVEIGDGERRVGLGEMASVSDMRFYRGHWPPEEDNGTG